MNMGKAIVRYFRRISANHSVLIKFVLFSFFCYCSFISRQFTRKYQLPAGSNANDVQSSLSSDGVLTITAPRKPPAPVNTERVVPITQTGPAQIKTEETATAPATAAPTTTPQVE